MARTGSVIDSSNPPWRRCRWSGSQLPKRHSRLDDLQSRRLRRIDANTRSAFHRPLRLRLPLSRRLRHRFLPGKRLTLSDFFARCIRGNRVIHRDHRSGPCAANVCPLVRSRFTQKHHHRHDQRPAKQLQQGERVKPASMAKQHSHRPRSWPIRPATQARSRAQWLQPIPTKAEGLPRVRFDRWANRVG